MIWDILTALQELLADLGVTVSAEAAIDDAGAEPFEWRPNTLYLYPGGTNSEVPFETGPTVRQDFSVMAVFMADSHEEASKTRDQGVSHLLDDIREFLMATARNNQSTVTWDHLRAAGSANRPRTLQGRAVAVEYTGWRNRG